MAARSPLADDFTPGARIDQLVCGDAGKLVGRGVTDAVAAGLDRVHLHFGQVRENIGHVFQRRPVELYVLAGTEVGVALVVFAGNKGQLAHLLGGDQAVRNGDTQHGRVTLYIQAVLQAQRQEFGVGQLAGQIAAGLVAELGYTFLDDPLVILVVDIHSDNLSVVRLGSAKKTQLYPIGRNSRREDSKFSICTKGMFMYMFRSNEQGWLALCSLYMHYCSACLTVTPSPA